MQQIDGTVVLERVSPPFARPRTGDGRRLRGWADLVGDLRQWGDPPESQCVLARTDVFLAAMQRRVREGVHGKHVGASLAAVAEAIAGVDEHDVPRRQVGFGA